MFDTLTQAGRSVIDLAQAEAQQLDHGYIDTEHVLLGLISEGDGVAAQVLTNLDFGLEELRSTVSARVSPNATPPIDGELPWSSTARRVFSQAVYESRQLGHPYVGTEHLLLGLIREDSSLAAQLIVEAGIDLNIVRRSVIKTLTDGQPLSRADIRTPPSTSGYDFEFHSAVLVRLVRTLVLSSVDDLLLAEALFSASVEKREQIRTILR